MDSGLGSDDDHHHSQQFLLGPASSSGFVLSEMTEPPTTKDQKQLRNRLLSMEAADEERRRGAMLFSSAQKTSQDGPEKKGDAETVPQNGPSDSQAWGSEGSAMSTSRDSENLMSSSETLVLSETCGDTPYNSMLEVSDGSAEAVRSLRRKPMGFFVDLSQIISDDAVSKGEPSSSSSGSSNKNIFSMVIDFEAPKKDKPVKLTSSMCRRSVKQPVIEPAPLRNLKRSSIKPVKPSNPKESNHANHKCPIRKGQVTRRPEVEPDTTDHLTVERLVDGSDVEDDKPLEPVGGDEVQDRGSDKTVQSFVKLSDMKSLAQPVGDREEANHSTVMSRSVPEVTSWLESPLSTMVLAYRSTIQPISNGDRRTGTTVDRQSQLVTSDHSYDSNMNHLDGSIRQQDRRVGDSKCGPPGSSPLDRSMGEDGGSLDGWEWSRECDLDHLNRFGGEVKIESADGRILRCHKNVLVSRCRYFAGVLVVEPSKNGRGRHHVRSLKDFSYESLRFALRHAYSGVLSHSNIPEGPAQLQELAHLADVLGIEGLRDFVEGELVKHMFSGCQKLRKTPSANFEGPDDSSRTIQDSLQESLRNFTAEYNKAIGFRSHSCPSCLSRCLIFVLPLASSRNFEELQRSCVTFLGSHFREAWLLREFHSLAQDLRDRCLRETTTNISIESCLKTRLKCEKLRADILRLDEAGGWEESEVGSALRLVERLEEELKGYLGRSYAAVLSSRHVTGLDDLDDEGVEGLLGVVGVWMLEAAGGLGVEQACRAYSRCWKMLETQLWAKRSFMEMLVKIRIRLEQVLVDQADRLIRSNAWLRLDTKLRKRIKDLAPKNLDMPYPRSRLPVPPQKKPLLPANKIVPPATNRSRPTDLGGVVFHETGGVSLRRSLLLAAKAPQAQQAQQVPAPSTNQRRVSSLTRPTAASAAKSVKGGGTKGAGIKRREEGGRRSDSPSASDHSVVSPKFGDRRKLKESPKVVSKLGNVKVSPKKEVIERGLSPRLGDRRAMTNSRKADSKESPKKETGSSPRFGDRRTLTNSKGANFKGSPKKEVASPQKGSSPKLTKATNLRQSPKDVSPRLGDRRGFPRPVNLKEIVSPKLSQGDKSTNPSTDDPKGDSTESAFVSPGDDVSNHQDGSPRMRRSSTFLKDEPTVLGKLNNL